MIYMLINFGVFVLCLSACKCKFCVLLYAIDYRLEYSLLASSKLNRCTSRTNKEYERFSESTLNSCSSFHISFISRAQSRSSQL